MNSISLLIWSSKVCLSYRIKNFTQWTITTCLGASGRILANATFFLFQSLLLTIAVCQSQDFQSQDKESLLLRDYKLNTVVTHQSLLLSHGSTCSVCFAQDLFGSSPHVIPHQTIKQPKFLKAGNSARAILWYSWDQNTCDIFLL